MKRWKKIFHANDDQKRTRMTVIISHRIDVTRDKEKHKVKRVNLPVRNNKL